ncbi:MAG: peptide deformylase [Candidatus Pacebacteria bacterium]|nr:peptide deformylase [Candidatus Paceibacterota bacterium]
MMNFGGLFKGKQDTLAETLEVCYYDEPVLRRRSKPVELVTPELRRFAAAMAGAMTEEDGIGLAAPQVGRNIRLITLATNQPDADIPPTASPGERMLWARMPLALVNPEIVSLGKQTAELEEGCLSLPGIYGPVVRPVSIVLRAQLLNGETMCAECSGMLARCLQHEIDHLDGVLFIDHLEPEPFAAVEPSLRVLKKETANKSKRREV